MNRIVMDDYDAGFMDAVKLLEKKLDAMIEKYEDILKKYDYIGEARDVELLLDVKRKLLTNSIDRVDLLCLTDLGFKIKYENK